MTTETLEQIALRVADDMLLQHSYDAGDYAAFGKEFARRLVAELTKGQEPVAYALTDESIEWYRPTTKRFIGPLYAAPPICPTAEWQPIETAPDNTLVVVGWLDADDKENPGRHDFDYKEDGCWMRHEDLYQEFCCVAPPESTGPKEVAPYTYWLEVPPLPAAPEYKP